MSNNSQQNSRTVTIFRANSFIQNAQTGGTSDKANNEAVQDWMDMSSKQIGPYLKSHTAMIMGSGLEIHEIPILLPHVINVDPEEKEFRKTVHEFYNNLTTKIPPNTGKTFEIGLLIDNSKPISKANLPINVEDYIRYRHAKSHPWVASSKSEAQANQLKYFYMNDPEAEVKSKSEAVVLQDKADGIWLSIKSQPQKIMMLLTMLGKDERDYSGRNAEAMKINDLHNIVKTKAPEFLKVYEGDRFETRYWLAAMKKADVVKEVGTSYIITQNNKLLGKSEIEALLFLENSDNVDTVAYLKANTQEVLSKPRKKK